ncbi:hypothetical protein LINPERPRIM_LOCUS2293 [Linum perenne]
MEQNPRCPRVLFSEDVVQSFYKPWSKALVVKVLEKTFSFGTMKRQLESLWARAGSIQVSDVANDFFLVRFSNMEDYRRAAFEGPSKIFDYCIAVVRWSPNFNDDDPISSVFTWVRVPKLPIHYFNNVAVTRIGNCIGKNVRLDLATKEGARARYARACVEVDFSKPLIEKYVIDNRTFYVESEGLGNICYTCGHHGHKVDGCPLSVKSTKESIAETGEASVVVSQSDKRDSGEWMTVSQRNRGKPNKGNQGPKASVASGSRFTPLHVPETAAMTPPSPTQRPPPPPPWRRRLMTLDLT